MSSVPLRSSHDPSLGFYFTNGNSGLLPVNYQ